MSALALMTKWLWIQEPGPCGTWAPNGYWYREDPITKRTITGSAIKAMRIWP